MSLKRRGSREEIVSELHEKTEGWHHLGKDNLSESYAQGAAAIEGGASEVVAGHTTYIVTDEG
jgi:hypothetical protein